jgi:hypothetical protein
MSDIMMEVILSLAVSSEIFLALAIRLRSHSTPTNPSESASSDEGRHGRGEPTKETAEREYCVRKKQAWFAPERITQLSIQWS